jgi:hypothetical protein
MVLSCDGDIVEHAISFSYSTRSSRKHDFGKILSGFFAKMTILWHSQTWTIGTFIFPLHSATGLGPLTCYPSPGPYLSITCWTRLCRNLQSDENLFLLDSRKKFDLGGLKTTETGIRSNGAKVYDRSNHPLLCFREAVIAMCGDNLEKK